MPSRNAWPPSAPSWRDQGLASDMAVNGAAGLGVGYAASRPIAKAVGAFAPNEDSATQLKVSMMDNTGKVAEDFKRSPTSPPNSATACLVPPPIFKK
ncbi:hypothetical protein MZE46_029320 [Pseudomonas sp. A4]|uniref:hypothetical protein n=1 Tax=Pseudomonas sp. S11A4 TaxID=1476791 RepID=UPI00215CA6F5|nr:hypothetical protein [Pseudomonas sp. S11A4]MCR8935687.1 hypothetical protein [Pseudomonas sp. S11A4]